jgi:hypothetical protein
MSSYLLFLVGDCGFQDGDLVRMRSVAGDDFVSRIYTDIYRIVSNLQTLVP